MEKPFKKVPMLPLRGLIVFPGMSVHLDVGRERSINALNEAMDNDDFLFLAVQRDASIDEPEREDLFEVGTLVQIKQRVNLPGGTIRILVEGVQRASIKEILYKEPFFYTLIQEFEEGSDEPVDTETKALMRSVHLQFERYAKLTKKITSEILSFISEIDDPAFYCDKISTQMQLKLEQNQELLESFNVKVRLEKLLQFLGYELEIMELEKQISSRVKQQMEKTQKDYYLREQMKAIQKELGEADEPGAEAEEYREKINEAELPEEVKQKALKEAARFEKMPPAAAEAVVIRTYLDWIMELPWSKVTEDSLDLQVVEKVLDEDHYGLEKVKNRIVEYIAVRSLTNKSKGPVLCLIGPPGVGKTSLARSVARAMQRKFVRISLGGIRDEAEIRGHRRTYVGALPGRIIQGMRHAESCNPVFLLDEVDKMSMDFRGDPSSALLEVLDPEQNHSFSDHYLELPYDLSQVMFITTANSQYTIPQSLLDRMEVINIPGYTEEEKIKIAQQFLIPRQVEEHGLTKDNLRISEGTIRHIVREYTREAGVRNLEREIANICRKTAREVVKQMDYRASVTRSNLHRYLGPPRYKFGLAEKQSEIGVSTGVAWTETGGDLLAIEVTPLKGKGNLILTGKLGDIMQESAQAALSFIRSRSNILGIDENFHEEYDLHVHIPEGAIPKEGPSAGITLATAMASALSNIPVDRHVALTGEITLRGRVLPVGGIKEKILAAHRAGIKTLIIPSENKKDLVEIPGNVRRRLEFILVDNMDQVLQKALIKQEQEEKENGNNKSEVLRVC